jgi:hypothetical protein
MYCLSVAKEGGDFAFLTNINNNEFWASTHTPQNARSISTPPKYIYIFTGSLPLENKSLSVRWGDAFHFPHPCLSYLRMDAC